MSITQDRCNELFEYIDGYLYRKITVSPNAKEGNLVGCKKDGYLVVRIDDVLHKVHRIVFLMHRGYLPDLIDHKDTNPLNNKIGNLREADKSKNSCNAKTPSTNTSGIKGVSWDSVRLKWRVYVTLHGKQYHLGRYKTREEAEEVVMEARVELHKEFANHGTGVVR